MDLESLNKKADREEDQEDQGVFKILFKKG